MWLIQLFCGWCFRNRLNCRWCTSYFEFKQTKSHWASYYLYSGGSCNKNDCWPSCFFIPCFMASRPTSVSKLLYAKKEYCRLFGISITDDDWPCSHIPLTLMCDNGEMIGLKPQEEMTPWQNLSLRQSVEATEKALLNAVSAFWMMRLFIGLLEQHEGERLLKESQHRNLGLV